MLGKLARWLRILGFDAAFENAIEDAELVERALSEDRILLTRDTHLVRRRRMPRHLLIESQDPAAQVRQTLAAFDLELNRESLLKRCLPCNRATAEIPREEARAKVPPYVFRTQDRFARCPECGRIYWRATHVEDILGRLEEVDPSGGDAGD